jgi:hypothetical protein
MYAVAVVIINFIIILNISFYGVFMYSRVLFIMLFILVIFVFFVLL